ncbi:MAG: hypothetical protein HY904_24210 [Deltaproteobacteria bacterium]|nr:hypothetical protein [Deltaproteobacteria bacterium]
MDRVRGVYLPVVLVVIAVLLALLGSLSVDDGRMLAARAQQMGSMELIGPAPKAQAEARKRVALKRAHAASTEGLALYGAAMLLGAAAALLLLFHLRYFRPEEEVALVAPPTGAGPAGPPGS